MNLAVDFASKFLDPPGAPWTSEMAPQAGHIFDIPTLEEQNGIHV